MNEWIYVLMYVVGMIQGLVLGYMLFAPMTNFKQGFIKGLSFNFKKSDRS